MSKISKLLILSLVIVSMASAAFATTTRVLSLANPAPYINDDSDVFRWYGTLSSYNNMVMAEAGQASGFGDISADYQALGFNITLGTDGSLGTWGVFLLYNSIDDGSFFVNNPLGNPSDDFTSGVTTPTTKLVFSWGYEVQDVISLGVMITNSNAMLETTTGGKNNLTFWTIGVGGRGDIGDNAYYDAAITFGAAGGDSLGGYDSGSSLDFAARVFYEGPNNLTLVPYFDWNTYNFAYTDIPATSGVKNSSDITLGLSLNWDVNTNNMLIFATEVEFLTLKPSKVATNDQTEVKITNLPKFYVALESDLTSWLTSRVGASKTLEKFEQTDDVGDKATFTYPSFAGGDFEWSLGLGFHLGEWDIDALLSHEAPFRVGYWVTGFGVNDGDPFITRVSGTYRF